MISSSSRFLDAEALAKLAGLQLRLQAVVDGTLAGIHSSPHHGSSIEFAEHKEYAPGDDLRHLDWKAMGRLDRLYIKRYEDETDLRAYMLLDCSGSMAYGEPLNKLEYASVLVASLAYLLVRQGDRPGLLTYADGVRSFVPPSARRTHMGELLGVLEPLQGAGQTHLAGAVNHLIDRLRHRCLIVVVSDLFEHDTGGLQLLRQLQARRNRVVLFHLLHPDELQLPFHRLTLFQSMEDRRQVLVDPEGLRKAYLRQMEHFVARTRKLCQDAHIAYFPLSCADALDQVLLGLLRSRDLNAAGAGRRAG